MKRRRRSLAAGFVVALAAFGSFSVASSDSFGRKLPPPPPPLRPNLSKQGFQEDGEGSEPVVENSARVSTKIIPPPPPRPQRLNVIPPPRIPPPPPRSLQSIQASQSIQTVNSQQDQRRDPPPPPPPPKPIKSKVKEHVRISDDNDSEFQKKDEAEVIEQEQKPEIVDINANPNDILERYPPPPPPPKPIESKLKEDVSIADDNDSEFQKKDEAEVIEQEQKLEIVDINANPNDILEIDAISEPAEEASEQRNKESPKENQQTSSSKADEVTLGLENQQSESGDSMKHPENTDREDTASFIASRISSEPKTTTVQNQEEFQNEKEPELTVQGDSPPRALAPKAGTGSPFVRSQTSFQRLESAEPQPRPQQQTFTMPLTHQHPTKPAIPKQPNRSQQHQIQQGSYRQQAPNQQRQYPSRVPPTHVRRPPLRTSTSAPSTSTFFKTILGSVEKGLDELSNVEEKISKRAQKLVSDAASSPSVSNVVQFATRSLPSRSSSSAHSTPKRATGSPFKTSRPPASSSDNMSPFTHLGKKYEGVTTAAKESSKPAVSQQLFRANGGASAPGGQTPNQPIPSLPLAASGSLAPSAQPEQRQQQQNQYSQPPSKGVNQSTQGSMQGIQSPYGATPPYKQSTESQSKPDPHSRQSRIPWEEMKTGTPRPSQTQMPVMNSSFGEDDVSWKEKLMGALPRLPRLPNPAKLFRHRKNRNYQYNMDAWDYDDDDSRRGLFGFLKKKASSKLASHSPMPQLRPSGTGHGETTTTPVDSLMSRSDGAKTTSLLSTSDETKCRSLGRYYAAFDFVQVMFLILGVQQMQGFELLTIPKSLLDFVSITIPTFVEIIRDSTATWAPFWFANALLTKLSRNLVLASRVGDLESEVASSVEDDSMYGQLYLRLVAATPIDTRLLSRLSQAAQSEVRWMISKARLSSFTTFVAGLLVFMTASVLRSAMMVVGKTAWSLVMLQEWRSWPIDWNSLWSHHKTILQTSFRSLETLFANFVVKVCDKPLDVAFHASLFTALLLVTLIPKAESKKTVPVIDDEEDEMEIANEGLDQISRLGASSATRLTMLSENGSVENVLERWRSSNVPSAMLPSNLRLSQVIRQMGYVVLAGLTTFAPLLIPFYFEQASSSSGLHTGLQWDSMLDVSVILISVFMLVANALKQSTVLQASLPYVKPFLSDLSKTMEEIAASNKQQVDLKQSASISANAGLAVRDLWAAHTTKRAWAVRGATLECRNGEVLAILGDDSSGKTRLLTTIAESLISPPKRSCTSNKVRGLVAIGGLDASKWDKPSLKRRLGILLSDVCTLGDTASIFSGWTLEEILEPVDGVQSSPHALTSSEKSAILLGLKITGLYGTLIRRLPFKMNTVVTGNEEDLGKTAVDPSTTFLSPAEWSKLLLAKVIAQTIADNDNVLASTDKIENSLMGSVLLLDDVTVLLSEVDEAKVIRELRQTGAATVISSNKWATGRFADRIAIVKDGAIVEVGSHNDLIARGPQQSLYAAKWHAMTLG